MRLGASDRVDRKFVRWIALLVGVLLVPAMSGAKVIEFRVTLDASTRNEPASGRLVVYLIRDGAKVHPQAEPAHGPFFEDPQPMIGLDVKALAPGDSIVIGDDCAWFPVKPSELPEGRYRAQAVLDTQRSDSSWYRENGNVKSGVIEFELKSQDALVEIALTQLVTVPTNPLIEGAELVSVSSRLLSDFRGEPVKLNALVISPIDQEPGRRYAAVYRIPGFGATHLSGVSETRARKSDKFTGDRLELAKSVFVVYLDPEGPNGHHLFANSANNGPVGRALVEELIPALEAKYPLITEPAARIVNGHSSGGWSSLWLTLNYPDTFGACWSTSPDPVDFRRFQYSDIYDVSNMYSHASTSTPGKIGIAMETPSHREDDTVTMTVRQENLMEEVMGSDNTSGQQWDSWQAVFGPRNKFGHPAALFDPRTGEVDRDVAEYFRSYDIGAQLRANPRKFAPIFRERIRLLVGGADNYYLNESVEMLRDDLNAVAPMLTMEVPPGYIRIVDGADHGSILRTEEARQIPRELLDYLRRNGLLSN